jgi:precorrin-8X/cobalt-precorrin-8 methylmutase
MTPTPVFDAYVMVDWSAAAVPQTGADSVWFAALEREPAGESYRPLLVRNPPTRRAAMHDVADLLSDLVARGRTVLVGFDFAFGYPAGLAARLSPECPDWRGVWRTLASMLRDDDDNANNRFEVAATLNQRLSGRAFPFWGCPAKEQRAYLTTTRPSGFAVSAGDGAEEPAVDEYRRADRAATGPQSPFKLAYSGSVGSQSLLGIAHLEALRRHPWLNGQVRIWPFETGLRRLCRSDSEESRLIFAEIYPSMLEIQPAPGMVKDRAQVEQVVRHFAALDAAGRLGPLFAGPPGLTSGERARIESEEAWILGIETSRRAGQPVNDAAVVDLVTPGSRRYRYLRDPDEIYRRSFAIIREETDLTSVPEDVRALAVRIIHACGDPSVAADLVASSGAAAAARSALAAGAPIFVDAEMVAAGIIRRLLPADNAVISTLADAGVAEAARANRTTRSAAAVDRWRDRLDGAVVVIGNAPTALFHLLELIDEGVAPPAAIFGFPVGFVGAAEAKEALIHHPAGVPFVTLRGRRGGSAMAAAAINALAGATP